jgi:hypothetical protein
MTTVRLIYAEYENGEPPFAWLDGKQLEPIDQQRIHRMFAHFAGSKARTARGVYGRAARLGEALMLTTSAGIKHASGAAQGVVVVLADAGKAAGWAAVPASRIGHLLAKQDIRVEEEQLRAALERSWTALTQWWPFRMVGIAIAYVADRARKVWRVMTGRRQRSAAGQVGNDAGRRMR